jgi:acetyltransferase-like isoleucine patch superfamily enzyme
MSETDFLSDPDLKESHLLRMLFNLARSIKVNPRRLAKLAYRLEGGAMRSRTLRRILWYQYGVRADAWSYGGLLEPGAAAAGLVVGRYASIAKEVRRGHNHPTDRIAMSPVFYEPHWGIADHWTIDLPSLEICPDAWIGSYSVIVGTCRRIGIGAVVGAGSVVTRDVPDFAIVVGAPARVVRYRFTEDVRERILASRWWDRSPEDLARFKEAFGVPAAEGPVQQALARLAADVRPRT